MFAECAPRATFVHRLDVRPKVLAFLVTLVALFAFSHPVADLLIVTGASLLWPYVGIPVRRLVDAVRPLVPILVIIVVVTALAYSGARFRDPGASAVLVGFPFGASVTLGGVLYGLTLALRIYGMVVLTSLLTVSTPIEDFLQLMHRAHAPYGLSFMLVTALRFIPTMQRRADMVQDAQRARGARLGSGGLFGQIRSFVPILVPLIAGSLRTSEDMAAAMLNRGYGATSTWTPLNEIRMRAIDWVAVLLLVGLLGVIAWLAAQGVGQLLG
jgi:energy-coupling factor transporter transmembrane protein EcfT